MQVILGIDTSNYTTSAALIDAATGQIVSSQRRLLPVKAGECGLRQSDAVFHHTAALPEIVRAAYDGVEAQTVAVAVSQKPSAREGSYMPCFLAGVNAASVCATALGVPLYRTSHQAGHVLACLYGCDTLQALKAPFLCFHVSGGTTDALLVSPGTDEFSIEQVACSMDLKAGQAIDRIGVKMGLPFPAGKALERLALNSEKHYKKSGYLKGADCSFSGLQNLAEKMISNGESAEDTAKFTLDYIGNTLEKMCLVLRENYGDLPLFFAGGVMSNSIIREKLTRSLGAYFAPAAYAADNAAGVAVYGYLQWNSLKN